MTASLPLPDDQVPETGGDAGVESPGTASAPRRPARAAPAAKRTTTASLTSVAASATPSPRSPRSAPRKPRAPRASITALPGAPVEAVIAPGPPPPLPGDIVVPPHLVIPPKPPPPPVADDAGAADIESPEIGAESSDAEAEPVAGAHPPAPGEAAAGTTAEDEDAVAAGPGVSGEVLVEAAEPDDQTTPAAHGVVVARSARGVPDADADPPALRLRGVTKRFGQTLAVDAIDLTVAAGSFYALVGPNGAGKTTTLSMIAGLLRPDRGDIVIGGIDIAEHATEAKRRMGVLPDRLRTFDRLTGRQLLYYYGVLRGLSGAVVESRTADLARAFDLVDALGRPVSDYSAGMTKKVMLAGAMIHSPRLLVLDEPFEAVDPVSSAVILDILTTYVEHGGTVILSSHGMELVERVCSGVAVLVAGHVLAEGAIDEVRGGLTLEERFLELAGGQGDLEGLEWLHTFSD